MKILITGLMFLIMTSCGTVRYVSVKVPYLPDFKCPPIVKPVLRVMDPETMSATELAVADEYNLQAAIRYRRSLTNHILCIQRNIKSIKKEIERTGKELEKDLGVKP